MTMNTPLPFVKHARISDLFDNAELHPNAAIAARFSQLSAERAQPARLVDPRAEVSCPSTGPEPSDREWGEAFAEWRPSCFGRLALEYATRFGLHVLPLLVDGGAAAGGAVPRGLADASRDPATIHAWWTQAPRANVGIACEPSGLLVLQVDPQAGGRETLAMHAQRLGLLPSTWTARTPVGCTQYFFSHADPDVSALLQLRPLGPGVQVEHRTFVLAPPSRIDGRHSAWHLDARPGRAPLAAMPPAWLDRLTGRVLPPNGLSGLDARNSILGRAFESLGWLGRMLDDGRRIVRCPWVHQHAWPGGAGGDTATVLYSPECEPWLGRFACRHPECAGRDDFDVKEVLPKEALEAACAMSPGEVRRAAFVLDDDLAIPIERLPSAQEAARELLGESSGAQANAVPASTETRTRQLADEAAANEEAILPVTRPSRIVPSRGYMYTPGRLQTLEEAAQTLSMSRAHLLEECEENAEQCNDTAVAYLPGGVVAIHCGEDWKFRFPVGVVRPSTEGA